MEVFLRAHQVLLDRHSPPSTILEYAVRRRARPARRRARRRNRTDNPRTWPCLWEKNSEKDPLPRGDIIPQVTQRNSHQDNTFFPGMLTAIDA